jgi:rare lipoprotein A
MLDGNRTASGVPYDKDAMTAAHRSLPFGTKVKVTYLKTEQSVEVVINDRGPHVKGRIIDLSGAAAKALGLVEDGHGKVILEVVAP